MGDDEKVHEGEGAKVSVYRKTVLSRFYEMDDIQIKVHRSFILRSGLGHITFFLFFCRNVFLIFQVNFETR